MRNRLLTISIVLLLSGCGYHLVGQGGGSGAVPADVDSISIESSSVAATELVTGLKRELTGNDHYKVISSKSLEEEAFDQSTHAVLRIERLSERFVASAYDVSGVATQYRMTLNGSVGIYREGERIWTSGAISKSGDVFVAGGPSGIEASRKRIREDLTKEWVFAAASRINSGF